MKFPSLFSSENMLMSVCGHLVLVAVLITSATLVVDRAKLVAPDRIEIYEIDLKDVKVSGNETKLFNTAPPPPVAKPEPKPEPKDDVKPEPKPEPVAEKPIEEPTLAEEATDKEEKQEEQKSDPVPTEETVESVADAPKKRTVVRVNRESLGLNRLLSVSVADALRVAMTRCWVIDKNYPGIGDIRAVAHLKMRQNGTVSDLWFEGAAAAESNPALAYVLETIRSAISVCQPLRMLPASEYKNWQDITLTFYPNQGKVM